MMPRATTKNVVQIDTFNVTIDKSKCIISSSK